MASQEDDPADIEGYYDAFAEDLDEYSAGNDWLNLNDNVRRAIELLPADLSIKALDLGSGTGRTLQAVQEHANLSEIVAVDISSKTLSKIKSKNLSPSPRLVHQRIEDYVAETDESFDLITAIGSLEFVPDLPASLQNIGRILRAGGGLAFSTRVRPETGENTRLSYSTRYKKAFREYFWDNEEIEKGLVLGGITPRSRDRVPAYDTGEGLVEYDFFVASK